MEMRRHAKGHADEKLWSGIRRGWRFGAEDFLERLVASDAAKNANPAIHKGDAEAETMEEKARHLVGEFFGKRKVGLEELRALKKGDPLKIVKNRIGGGTAKTIGDVNEVDCQRTQRWRAE